MQLAKYPGAILVCGALLLTAGCTPATNDSSATSSPTPVESSPPASTTSPNDALSGGVIETPAPTPTPTPTPEPTPTVDCTLVSCVALTFDDGPGPYTNQLLDELAEKKTPATFFVLGAKAQTSPDIVAREVNEGHAVGSHTWNHYQLTKLTPDALASELDNTTRAITAAGASAPTMVRPPYGAKNSEVMEAIKARGAAGIFWDIDSEDWKNKSTAITTARALEAQPGDIILMHDIHPSTVQAVPGIIDQLRAKGYTLVTVPELLGKDPSELAGMQVYSQTQIR